MPAAPERGLPPAPPVRRLERRDTHRLIPSRFSEGGESVLVAIADDDAHLAEIFELDGATNDRLLAENERLPGIGVHELVFGVPHYRVVNAAFTHAHPLGSRFEGPDRGTWYAAFAVATAQAEVAWHKTVELAEVGWREESVAYDDYLADFTAEVHDLRGARGFAACLAPDSYVASQALAERLVAAGAFGLVYPSVRHKGGTCLACFRPALVNNVRKHARYRFTWTGEGRPVIMLEMRY
jgi:hypothetical protein